MEVVGGVRDDLWLTFDRARLLGPIDAYPCGVEVAGAARGAIHDDVPAVLGDYREPARAFGVEEQLLVLREPGSSCCGVDGSWKTGLVAVHQLQHHLICPGGRGRR